MEGEGGNIIDATELFDGLRRALYCERSAQVALSESDFVEAAYMQSRADDQRARAVAAVRTRGDGLVRGVRAGR